MEWAWLIPFYCLVAFAVLGPFRRYLPWEGKHLSIVAILAGFVTFWFVLFSMLDRGAGSYHFVREWFTAGDIIVAWGIIVDPLAVVMLGLITFVALSVQLYSLAYMRHHEGDRPADQPRIGWYFAVHSLFAASMLGIVLADNLLLLYVGWELVGICSYLLIGFWYERPSAAEAAKKAFITTRIGDVGLLIGILLLASTTGTFDITEILARVADPAAGQEISSTVLTWSALLIFLGAMGKSAQFPLHVWLPDAMEGPTPVSALIHAATMVAAGVFLVARLFPMFDAVATVQVVVAAVGITTALVGASLALVSTDLKRILAYSTVSHLGFMMLALGAGGFTAAIFHLITHGLAKAMLFLSAGAVMHAMPGGPSGDGETDIRKMGGLRRRMPITAAAFTIGALALSGIPPLSAFWSKDEIIVAVQEGLNPIFLVLLLVAVVLSALYMARALRLAFFGLTNPETEAAHDGPLLMSAPLIVLGALTLVVGFIALPLGGYDGIGSFLFSIAPGAHGEGHAFEFNALWGTVGLLLAAGGFAGGWVLYAERRDVVDSLRTRFAWAHQVLENHYYLDTAYQWVIDQVVLRTGQAVASFDRQVINDRAVNGIGLTVLSTGRRLRQHVTGVFADYGAAMAAGVTALALFLWLRT